MRSLSPSIKIYVGIIVVLAVLLAVIIALKVDATIPVSQRAQLTVPLLLLAALLGLVGVYLSERTGFPGIWDAHISIKRRLLIPLLLGAAFGVGFVVLRFFQLLPDLDGPSFPGSIPYFLYGGVLGEILYRLFPMPLLVWLVSNLLLRGKAQGPVSWTAVVLTSLLEPLSQVGAMLLLGINSGLGITSAFALIFTTNIAQGCLFRKYGFGACVVMRLAFYLVWHIIL